jgi:hypothetical protein
MAGNVTILVGNGLDISLELKTSYSAFYNFVKKNGLHPENSIYKAIAKDKPEWWADFELGLGRFTHTIEQVTEKEREQWSQTLNEELDEIKKDLKKYIKEQNDSADEKIDDINFSLSSLYNGLEVGQVANVRRFFTTNPPTTLRFVTLNYTNVLEKLFPNRGRQLYGQDFIVAGTIHHVHGSINRRISLGVNDESQISSYIDPTEKDYLIKPKLIQMMNDRRIETLRDYINAAELMVLFGLSLGATDKYIWEMVIEWLHRGDRMLIIHHYEEGLVVDDLTERESLRLEERVKNKFLDYSDVNDDIRDQLKSKIYVIANSETLFHSL